MSIQPDYEETFEPLPFEDVEIHDEEGDGDA